MPQRHRTNSKMTRIHLLQNQKEVAVKTKPSEKIAKEKKKEKLFQELKESKTRDPPKKTPFGKRFLLGLIFLPPLILILVTVSILLFSLNDFTKVTETSTFETLNQLVAGIKNPYQKEQLSLLVLGTDKRVNDQSLLTDTIILITINAKTGNYTLFSVPRDLWLDDLKTKINALYYYGQKENPDSPLELVEEKVEQIFETSIDYSIVLGMDNISQIIDLLGGISVDVEKSFTDDLFPIDDGSNQVMTVSFEKGDQFFDGQEALQFARSRKSQDPEEGTDQARQKRQKKVILAIKDRVKDSPSLLLKTKTLANIYLFLTEKMIFEPKLEIKTIASFWRLGLKVSGGQQNEVEMPWKGEKAILLPGRDPVYNTWILEPKNKDWQPVRNFFSNSLPE